MYDYDLDGYQLDRYNRRTSKVGQVRGRFADHTTALRAAKSDIERLRNLAKGRPVEARFGLADGSYIAI